MSEQEFVYTLLIISVIAITLGISGILKRKVIANHAHLVLSVGQLGIGIIGLLVLAIVYFKGDLV